MIDFLQERQRIYSVFIAYNSEPYILTVYDRMYGDIPAKIPYIHRIHL